MKIGFLSDTHENVKMIKKAIEFFNQKKPDLVIHLGDICSPIMGNYFKDLKIPLKIIFGNNDGDKEFLRVKFSYAELFDGPYEFQFDNFKIICMHKPEFINVFAKSGEYRLIAHGHTHFVKKEYKGNTLILNPGEVMGGLTGKSTVVIYDSEKNDAEFYDLENGAKIDVIS